MDDATHSDSRRYPSSVYLTPDLEQLLLAHPGAARNLTTSTTDAGVFARTLALACIGNLDEALDGLAKLSARFPVPCELERCQILVWRGENSDDLNVILRNLRDRTPLSDYDLAQWEHLVGQVAAKQMAFGPSLEYLSSAVRRYRGLGCGLGAARVDDSLGMLHSSKGHVDLALKCFSMSLAEKSMAGDRFGMAITLGNIGRLMLQLGNLDDALVCFQNDLALSRECDDRRGIVRMNLDIARISYAKGDYESSRTRILEAMELAASIDSGELRYFILLELARAEIQTGNTTAATRVLDECRSMIPQSAPKLMRALAGVVECELSVRTGSGRISQQMMPHMAEIARSSWPEIEIPTRLFLARCFFQEGHPGIAETHIRRAMMIASELKHIRFLPELQSLLTRLEMSPSSIADANGGVVEVTDRRIGPYVIREKLGEGGYGQVFRCVDSQDGKIVAVKQLSLAHEYAKEKREATFLSARCELEAVARINHPGVAAVYLMNRNSEGDLFVVQEYIEGPSIRKLMPTTNDADLPDVLDYCARICECLSAVHENHVLHRDLKPENILLRMNRDPVLVDFGIAAIDCSPKGIAGTIEYMSPEQATGGKLDERTDLYSLGVILFEWLAGIRPLRLRGNSIELMVKDLSYRIPPPLTEFRKDVPPELNQLVASLLAKRPRKRPVNAEATGILLHKIRHGLKS